MGKQLRGNTRDTALPMLRVPRANAEQMITARIRAAEEMDVPSPLDAYAPGAPEEVEREIRKWRRYNEDMLLRLFGESPIVEEYDWRRNWTTAEPGENPGRRLWIATENLQRDIRYLESVSERLELYPELDSDETANHEPDRPPAVSRRVFVVHGRNDGIKHSVARFLEKLDLKPIILHEQPNKGRTIIEKFEAYADVGFAVVILTPDDEGKLRNEKSDPRPRARQNVVFELGFFLGRLGRDRVCPLYLGSPELPSDYQGVAYQPINDSGAWRMELAREISAAGIDVDLNRLKD